MRQIIMTGLGALLLGGCYSHVVMECYFTPHVVGGQTNYQGPCKQAPEGKYK